MIRLLVLLLSFTSFLFSLGLYDSNETNETNSSTIPTIKEKSIFLSYKKIPDKVYIGEVFTIKIKAIIANDDFEEITSEFANSENLDIINPDAKWKWFSDNIFYNTFYMKVNDISSKLPDITLNIYLDEQKIDSAILERAAPNMIKLKGTKEFSSVIAKSLQIKKYKTNKFDDKSLIIVLEMAAEQSNLGNFHLKNVIRDGIDSSVENLPFHKIFYYAIIPDYQKKFEFTYFNSVKNKFEKFSLPIVLNDDTVSTQIDLNPAQNSLQIYKDSSYAVLALILIILFIRRKKITYIIFLIILIGLFVYDKNPLNSIKIEKNTHIKILPTQKSTIFYTTNRTLYAQELDKKNKYIKILLPNGKIGWIDDSKN